MKKRILSLVLTLAMVLSCAPIIAKAERSIFTDVLQSHWAYEIINELTNEGVIDGMGDGTFAPEGLVTREQFMKLLVCALNCGIDSVQTQELADVNQDNWSAPYIFAGVQRGIYNVDISGDMFYPAGELKRGISAEWIVDGLGVDAEAENIFSDIPSIGSQSEAVAIATKLGIVSGYEDNTFRAENTITRAEAAALIKRIMDYQSEQYDLREDAKNEIELQDNVEMAESSEVVNIPISADENNKVVTFSKADETLKTLEVGEILLIQPCDNLPSGLFGKVVSVDNGKETKIKFEEPSLTEVVKSIDISTYVSANIDNFSENGELKAVSAVKGVSSADNGLTFDGKADADADISIKWGSVEVDAYANANEKAKVHFETESYKKKEGVYAAVDMGMEVKVDIQLETDNFDITKFEASADLLTDISAVGGYSNSKSKEYTYELPSCSIPVAGLFSIAVDSSLVVQADGSLNIEATADFDNDMGMKFTIDDGFTTHNTTNAKAELTVDAEGSLKMGPKEEVKIVFCGLEIGNRTFFDGISLLEADASFGIGANGQTTVNKSVEISNDGISFDDEEIKHLCYFCIEGDIIAYFNGDVGIGDDVRKLISKICDKNLTYTFADKEEHLSDWHLSSGEGYTLEFELQKCPHYEIIEQNNAEEYVPNVTFSAPIGEVNGMAYSVREVPGLNIIPIETSPYNSVSSFCYYDGYIYYIESEGGSSDYRTWVYRCTPDWRNSELLTESSSRAYRLFSIDNGKLYYDRDQEQDYCINLHTMEFDTDAWKMYPIDLDTTTYVSQTYKDDKIFVYDGRICKYNGTDYTVLVDLRNESKWYKSNKYIGISIDGVACGYVYYSYIANNNMATLYRVSIDGGESEFVDEHMAAGGGLYFNW